MISSHTEKILRFFIFPWIKFLVVLDIYIPDQTDVARVVIFLIHMGSQMENLQVGRIPGRQMRGKAVTVLMAFWHPSRQRTAKLLSTHVTSNCTFHINAKCQMYRNWTCRITSDTNFVSHEMKRIGDCWRHRNASYLPVVVGFCCEVMFRCLIMRWFMLHMYSCDRQCLLLPVLPSSSLCFVKCFLQFLQEIFCSRLRKREGLEDIELH